MLSNGTGVECSDELARDTRLKVLQRASPPPAIVRAIQHTLKVREDGIFSSNVRQAQSVVNTDLVNDNNLNQGLLPMARRLGEAVQTFCRTPERERRLDLLAVMREETRRLRNALSAANFEALATLTSALDRLFTGLSRDVEAVNVSTLKTICHATDFMLLALSSRSGREEMGRTPIRVLAVDDDPVCLRTMSLLAVNNKTLSVVVCDGSEAALRELKSGHFDLIFSDIMMPGMNGFDLVTALRKLPQHSATPVVFVTCLSDFETKSRSVLTGSCDFIAKPFTAAEVLVKALALGLKRRFESANTVGHTGRPPQEPKSNGTPKDPEVPAQNNGANGPVTLEPVGLTLLGSAARGVIVIETSGDIRLMNMAAAELMGYRPGEAVEGGIRALIPDELQLEENKTMLGQVMAGKVKNQSGLAMTGRRKDHSTIPLLVALGETCVQGTRSIICLLQTAAASVSAGQEVSMPISGTSSAPDARVDSALAPGADSNPAAHTDPVPAINADPVIPELHPPLEPRNLSLAELIRAKEYWESCANERAAMLEDLRSRLRSQDSTVQQAKESAEQRRALEQDLAASRGERDNLQAELKVARVLVDDLEKTRVALGQELGQSQQKVGALASRLVELENQLGEESSQRESSKLSAVEFEKGRAALQGEIRQWAEREARLRSECAQLEQLGQESRQSLSQTRALLAQETAGSDSGGAPCPRDGRSAEGPGKGVGAQSAAKSEPGSQIDSGRSHRGRAG